MLQYLDFEKPVAELENKIAEFRQMVKDGGGINISDEIAKLSGKVEKQLRMLYAKLTPWQKVLVARHAQRPQALQYFDALLTEFTPLAGDRLGYDDQAIIGGMGRLGGRPVIVIGTQRGYDTESRLKHNFGMPKPEGYRKAQRLVELAGRFKMPILTFVDTSGAWPGIDAEARGQAEAIAQSVACFLRAPVPTIATIIGEGGSGGAVALAATNSVMMLEHSIYSVIAPEGAASILWRDPKQASVAAEALKLTAPDLLKLKLIDRVIEEPVGGAQRRPEEAIESVGAALNEELERLTRLEPGVLLSQRRDKFLSMGHAH